MPVDTCSCPVLGIAAHATLPDKGYWLQTSEASSTGASGSVILLSEMLQGCARNYLVLLDLNVEYVKNLWLTSHPNMDY